jgi:hypothetical protein
MSERYDLFGGPDPAGQRNPDLYETVAAEEGAEGEALDPREAAALLEEATKQAQQRFDLRPTFMIFAAAVTVLIAYGAVWLSVRHQHPYSGPTGTALAELYGTLGVWIALNVAVMHRSLSGRSSRQRRLEGIVFGAIWVCVYVFQGALHHADPSHAIAYGVYPAVAPLIVVGAAAAGYEVGRQEVARAVFAAAAVLLGALAAFAGPAGVWGVTGVGLCCLLLVGGAAQLWQRHARG